MSNLLRLVAINLRTSFSIDKILNSKNKNELKKSILKSLLVVVLIIYFGWYIYYFSNTIMKGFMSFNEPHLLFGFFFCIISSFLLMTNIYKVNGTLFNYGDYDLLMSLPISKNTVIISKFLTLYVSSMFYVLIFMIPAFITYVQFVSVNALFCFLYFISLFIIPLVPIVISTIIGSIITAISSRFKFKNLFQFIFMFALVLGIMYLSFSMDNMSSIDLSNIGKSITNFFNNIYPLTGTYIDIIKNLNIFSLLIFIFISFILFSLFLIVIRRYYISINNNLSKSWSNKHYKLKVTATSPLMALYKKELKRYFSSVNYVLNTMMGAIFLTISTILLIFFGGDKIDAMMGIEGIADMFAKTGPILLGAFCALNCTTHSSISLEGKNLWIIKSLPVSPMSIYISKILVNLTIILPFIIIDGIALCIFLKLDLITCIFMILTPCVYALCTSLIGIVLNLIFPQFDWKYEIKVIKQSLPAFLSIIIGMLFAIVPLSIKYTISDTLYTLLITLIVLVISILLYSFLKIFGVKKFSKLGE